MKIFRNRTVIGVLCIRHLLRSDAPVQPQRQREG